jgi:hypothetical protein
MREAHQKRWDSTIARSVADSEERLEAAVENRQETGVLRYLDSGMILNPYFTEQELPRQIVDSLRLGLLRSPLGEQLA